MRRTDANARRRMIGLAAGCAGVILASAAPALAQGTRGKMGDTEIRQEINEALIENPGVRGYKVDVSVSRGVATLSGTVENILARDRAIRLARSIRGVRSVVDRIDVMETDADDQTIEQRVERALAADPATESWEIMAEVEDGRATLTGSVDSLAEKDLAAHVAKSARGVRGLTNEIEVMYDTLRPESEIEAEVRGLLRADTLVDDALINVNANGPEVNLTGTVGSAAERWRAITDAWVRGVTMVDATGLEVEAWARDDRFRRGKYGEKSDQWIEEAVATGLEVHPRVTVESLDVTVDDGMVTLDGRVDNLKSKRAAAKTARNTVGVERVRNLIDVRPSTPTDDQLARRVRRALERDPYVSRYEVSVDVVNGRVILTGTVDDYFEKAQADDAAARVYGTVSVDNNLVVGDEWDYYTYDPYVDDWFYYDYDWYVPTGYTTFEDDMEIAEDIRDELFWSPFVDSDDVSVSVDNGVATLTGEVDSWSERSSARENAYEGGATAVINEIDVDPTEDN